MKRSSLFVCLVLILLLVMAGIPIASASPKITSVSPSTAPNDGYYTVEIKGSGLTGVTTVRLNKCIIKTGDSSEAPFTGTFSVKGDSKIVATFNLKGKKIGQYDVSVNAPHDGSDDWGVGDGIFQIYSSTGSTPTATKTTGTGTTTEPTETASGEGDNSVFFETTPSGATIFLNGEEIGTSTFTYYTNRDGTYDVLVKKLGFEDYEAKVTIIRGKRVHFSAPLTQLSAGSTPVITGASGTPIKTVTTNKRITLKLTPLGTFEPPAEESPAGPATVMWAVALGIALLVVRRR
jgi:PEGA domain